MQTSGTIEDNRRETDVGLELKSLSKKFGETVAVRKIDLKVERGEFLTVLGPSGSGKTTVLRMIAGFTEPSSGSISLAAVDVSRLTPAERNIGMVFQNYALFPHLSAGENIGYGLKMRGWAKADRNTRVDEMLKLVGLDGYAERLPKQLSGGQQQRIALARALAFGPDLLLMDEPLGALDRELRLRMAGELRRIHAETGTTVVYVTHDREEALTLSDRIAVMLDGSLEAVATPESLYRRPSSSFVATFFGGHNLLPVEVVSVIDDDEVLVASPDLEWSIGVTVGAPLGSRAALVIPAQAFRFADDDDAQDRFILTAREAIYMGDVTRIVGVLAAKDGSSSVEVQVEIPGHHLDRARGGSSIPLVIDVERCVAVPWTKRANGHALEE